MSDKQNKEYNPLNYDEHPPVVVERDAVECCICNKNEMIVTIDCCKNKICYNCIRKWNRQGKKSCPYCRADIPIESEPESEPERDRGMDLELLSRMIHLPSIINEMIRRSNRPPIRPDPQLLQQTETDQSQTDAL